MNSDIFIGTQSLTLTEEQRTEWISRRGTIRKSKLRKSYANKEAIPDWLIDTVLASDPSFFAIVPTLSTETQSQIPPGVQREEVEDTLTSGQSLPQIEEVTFTGTPIAMSNPPTTEPATLREKLAKLQSTYTDRALAGATQEELNDLSKRLEALNNAIEAEEADDQGENVPINVDAGQKRKFGWFLDEYARHDDIYNQRNADGTLKKATQFPEFQDDEGNVIKEGADLPDSVLTEDFFNTWETLMDINGSPFYDAETNALGPLEKNLYMLIPSNWDYDICPLDQIGGGQRRYRMSVPVIAGVYALAKDQYKGIVESDAIKWAVLRMEAFKAGWFDHQKYCVRKAAPKDSVKIMSRDLPEIKKWATIAWTLSSFLPYLTEFCFRAYGSNYNSANASEYTQRAEKLAKSGQISDVLNYLPGQTLYAKALRWIGVQRPMQVLRLEKPNHYVPNIFLIRKKASPAGQALITSSYTVIRTMSTGVLWGKIRNYGQYDESTLISVSNKIAKDPWQYHQMHTVYGLPPLSDDDKLEVEKAKEFATMVAPILQAYLDVVMSNTDLGKIKSLQRAADAQMGFYTTMKSVFKATKKKKPRNLEEAFQVPKEGSIAPAPANIPAPHAVDESTSEST